MSEQTRGDRWSQQVRANFVLGEDATALVTEAARLIDRVEVLQELIDAGPLMIQTSQGQRLHPAIAEQRSTVTVLQRLLASLNLPAPEEGPGA